MTVDPDEYRDAVRKFATGVTVVTVASEGQMHGMTASSFASVSLVPPRILVCLDKTSQTRSFLERETRFAVNILAVEQEDIARSFALAGEKPWQNHPHRVGETGPPLLEGAIGWLECETVAIFDGGDHDVLLGEVQACGSREGAPLVYFDRAYRTIHTT